MEFLKKNHEPWVFLHLNPSFPALFSLPSTPFSLSCPFSSLVFHPEPYFPTFKYNMVGLPWDAGFGGVGAGGTALAVGALLLASVAAAVHIRGV